MAGWERLTRTASEAAELVELKALLGQALQAAHLQSSIDRQIAVLLLDATVERALHMAAASQGATLGDKPTIVAACDKVYDVLKGAGWSRPAWGDVRKLHFARNQAQHAGLSPDRDLIPGWAAATEEFVRSLVNSAYGTSLDSVWLASAIEDDDLRTRFQQAEQELANDQPFDAVHTAVGTFEAAKRQWQALHSDAITQPRRPHQLYLVNDGTWDYVNRKLDLIDDYALVEPFAQDLSEYMWLQTIGSDRNVPISVEEGTRALRFVFWWIIRYEAFSRTFIVDRRGAWLRAQRAVRTNPSDPARVSSVRIRRAYDDDEWVLEFGLVNVPGEAQYLDWFRLLLSALDPNEGNRIAKFWRQTESGSLSCIVNPDVDVTILTQTVDDALSTADRDLEAGLAGQEREAAAAEQSRREYGEQVARYLSPWPVGIDTIEWDTLRFGPGDRSMTRLQLSDGLHVDFQEIRSALMSSDVVSECFPAPNGGVGVQPVVEPSALADVLAPLVDLMAQRHREMELAQDGQRRRHDDLERRLQTAAESRGWLSSRRNG